MSLLSSSTLRFAISSTSFAGSSLGTSSILFISNILCCMFFSCSSRLTLTCYVSSRKLRMCIINSVIRSSVSRTLDVMQKY